MSAQRLENVGAGLGTLSSEIAPRARADIEGTRFRHRERRQAGKRGRLEPFFPLVLLT